MTVTPFQSHDTAAFAGPSVKRFTSRRSSPLAGRGAGKKGVGARTNVGEGWDQTRRHLMFKMTAETDSLMEVSM